jgi:MerR family copper efflux transcriptional regulator
VQGKVKSYAAPVRIGELAQRTGTTTKTLRFYEQAGLLPEPDRTPSGYRDYDESVVDRLRFVRAAQTAGLSLAEIRDVIAAREHSGPPCGHVAGLLDAHAFDLDQRIAELSVLRDDIRRLRERAKHLDPARCDDAAVCHVIPATQHDGRDRVDSGSSSAG